MPSESSRERLPFEPRQKKKKSPKTPPTSETQTVIADKKQEASLRAIPDVVNKRMARRMALFCGIPSGLGMASFIIAYTIVSNDWAKIPTPVVVTISLGLFGLGVLGLSYGIFSASWDEDRVGSWWGWQEFKVNFGRTVNAWRTGRKDLKNN